MNSINRRTSCIVCDHRELIPFFHLSRSPVHCNRLWNPPAQALWNLRVDSDLVLCAHCGLVFNLSFQRDKMRYSPDYENSLHFSPRFQRFAKNLALDMMDTFHLENKNVIEIGSGDGFFLSLLSHLGAKHGIGFDPGYLPPSQRAADQRGDVVEDENLQFFKELYPNPQVELDFPPDFILCRHVLEHLEDPLNLLQEVRAEDVPVYFEVPNFGYILEHFSYWDILYEHHLYFTRPALTYLFRKAGFHVRRLRETFGGQYLSLEALPVESDTPPVKTRADEIEPLLTETLEFGRTFQQIKAQWQEFFSAHADQNTPIVVWGIGSKGIIFLNHIAPSTIRYGVDINPRKRGRFVPGTGQEVVSPDFLKNFQPQIIILMNQLYEKEIQAELDRLQVQCRLLQA